MVGERQCSDCHKYGNPGTDGCRIMHQNGEKAFRKSRQNIHLKIPLGTKFYPIWNASKGQTNSK